RAERLPAGREGSGAVAPVTVIGAEAVRAPTRARTVAVPGARARTVPDVTAAMSGLEEIHAAPRAAAGAADPSFMVPDSTRSWEAPAAITRLAGLMSSAVSCLTARFVRVR